MSPIPNPFKPGAGHMPPYLAGRDRETREFDRVLSQSVILENVILTGLRGLGKTVLLESFKPMAIARGWLWVGTDLSEAASLTEERMAMRLIADLAVVTSAIPYAEEEIIQMGFGGSSSKVQRTLTFDTLISVYSQSPGLVADKLKKLFLTVWAYVQPHGKKGIIFAYDEAQNLSDSANTNEFPMSLLLDVFQSIQRQSIPFMLVLTGLPTLLPKLVEARTYAERMFHTVFLNKLDEQSSKDAITKPIEDNSCPINFAPESVESIYRISAGYPYFIQYICREVFDIWLQALESKEPAPPIPIDGIQRKLDADFFSGRWARATDRQRELLKLVVMLPNCEEEFTVQEIAQISKEISAKPFSNSHINQMLSTLAGSGLVYKDRRGKYCFAVPLLGQFIKRQTD